ncbi:branched-chain amino acid ABC transporter permease [Dehalobacterium formicoaceticum]|uniref:Branched-chain amino acid ABC transporter permease n=1 Tax=Dehalobacterium formicoaceticum TaxID=51515 RepID=A0ABT1Y5H9_9FIRM|nr:branched-chain amino acid ABC transporter permease [Dehalobacterium formicoaceticum]MCR6545380.1 branched-chain amino acid ABC transporter permease [Dehalobacterium formicoaceticum]
MNTKKENVTVKIKFAVLGILCLLVVVLPLISDIYVMEVMTNAFFYMILCLGLNITVGYCGLLNLGNAAFFAFGAYTTGILMKMGISFWLTIPAAMVISIIVACIIGGPTLKLRSDYLAIVTLGFGEITRLMARNLEITGGASGLVGIPRPEFLGMKLYLNIHFYYTFFILVILGVIIAHRLLRSRFGRALEYIREDEDAAEAMGINTVKFKLLAYIVGSLFAGVAGSFYAIKMTAVSPETFLFTQSANVLLAVVLGGMGKIQGALLGAFVLALFPEIFRGIGEARMLFFGIVLVFIMIFRPQGLWPERKS